MHPSTPHCQVKDPVAAQAPGGVQTRPVAAQTSVVQTSPGAAQAPVVQAHTGQNMPLQCRYCKIQEQHRLLQSRYVPVQLKPLWCRHVQEQHRLLLSRYIQVQLRPLCCRHVQEQHRLLLSKYVQVHLRPLCCRHVQVQHMPQQARPGAEENSIALTRPSVMHAFLVQIFPKYLFDFVTQ